MDSDVRPPAFLLASHAVEVALPALAIHQQAVRGHHRYFSFLNSPELKKSCLLSENLPTARHFKILSPEIFKVAHYQNELLATQFHLKDEILIVYVNDRVWGKGGWLPYSQL